MEQTVAAGQAEGARQRGDNARRSHGFRPMTMVRFTLLLVLATIAIEALLAFRAWVQLSGWQLDIGALRAIYAMSTALVAPFRGLETTSPIRQNDILELATVVAVEAYLVIAVVAFGFGLLVHAITGFITLRFDHEGLILARKAERQTA